MKKILNEKGTIEVPDQTMGWITKEVLSFKEALVLLNISSSMLYKLTHKRTISYSKPNGKLIYFKRADLINWMLTNKQPSLQEVEKEVEKEVMNDLKRRKHGK